MHSKPLIFVVDDSTDVLQTVAEVLVEEGCEPLTAASADEALRLLATAATIPDVILLDVIMPGMTTRRFISIVRDKFLPKPFRIEELMQVLRIVGVEPTPAHDE